MKKEDEIDLKNAPPEVLAVFEEFDEKNLDKPETEELESRFAELLRTSFAHDAEHKPILTELCALLHRFLNEQPEPPQEWKERLGDQAKNYDYHQICFPENIFDYELSELENLEQIPKRFDKSFMALEHNLMTSNRFVFLDGHFKSLYCPKPLFILESDLDENGVADEDYCLILFSDKSFYAYNLEDDQREIVGADAEEFLHAIMPKIRSLKLVLPHEGVDYGILKGF